MTEAEQVAAHCAHAAGLADGSGFAPCTDPEPEPTFCELYTATCGDFPTDFGSDCETWYSGADAGTENDATGASQACYDYHLGVATQQSDQAMIDAHCAHSLGLADANGSQYCVADPDIDGDGSAASVDCDDTNPNAADTTDDADCDGVATTADCDDSNASINPNVNEILGDGVDNNCDPADDEDFCLAYEGTCGSAITDCATWFSSADPGTPNDSSGASQACYTYHYNVAAGETDQAMIDAHCAHAAGQADGNGTAPCQ
jgi:hypothetical protein